MKRHVSQSFVPLSRISRIVRSPKNSFATSLPNYSFLLIDEQRRIDKYCREDERERKKKYFTKNARPFLSDVEYRSIDNPTSSSSRRTTSPRKDDATRELVKSWGGGGDSH